VRDKGEIAAKWRHDMKNHLGVILGFSEMLLSEPGLPDVHRQDVREIHDAARRALGLLESARGEEAGG
jgi:signal transduction histidine kinase